MFSGVAGVFWGNVGVFRGTDGFFWVLRVY